MKTVEYGVSVCRSKTDGISLWVPEMDGTGKMLKFSSPKKAIAHARLIWKTTKRSVSVVKYVGEESSMYWSISESGITCQEAKKTVEFVAPIVCDCFAEKRLYCHHRMKIDASKKRAA
jgi:hypothetical protein